MFKSVGREKRFGAACIRVSVCLLVRINLKFAAKFCNIGKMSKYETKFPSTHLMNRVKIVMTSFSLAISRWFRVVKTVVALFFVKKPIICAQ
jgi:hypothetical protein